MLRSKPLLLSRLEVKTTFYNTINSTKEEQNLNDVLSLHLITDIFPYLESDNSKLHTHFHTKR